VVGGFEWLLALMALCHYFPGKEFFDTGVASIVMIPNVGKRKDTLDLVRPLFVLFMLTVASQPVFAMLF
jgi:hypothetical protein